MPKKETTEEKQQREMVESIAANIESLSVAVKSLLGGKIKMKTVVILLAHSTGMSQRQVSDVLVALQDLGKDYLN